MSKKIQVATQLPRYREYHMLLYIGTILAYISISAVALLCTLFCQNSNI